MATGRLTVDHFMEEQAGRDAAAIAMRDRIVVLLEEGANLMRAEGIKPHKLYRIPGSQLLDIFPVLAEKVRALQPK